MEIITPPAFGAFSKSKYAAINDCVQLDVYSSTDLFLETIPRALDYSIDAGTLSIDLEKELTQANYLAGDFRVTARLVRNVLGSSDGLKVTVQEVSENRLEVRVQLVLPLSITGVDSKTSTQITQDFSDWFANKFFTYDKQSLLANLYLYSSINARTSVFDYIQDKITIVGEPYSIIFKLTSPLPANINIGDEIWFSQDIANVITEDVRIVPTQTGFGYQRLKGPNFDALTEFNQTKATDYKDWDDLLGTVSNKSLTTKLFSGSLVEGIDLNVDYRQFENFVFYGSAYERIKNFEYKVQLLEYYDSILASLSTGVSKTSTAFVSQSSTYQLKKQTLIGTFDGFERYMYNESSSFVSNSFGQFLDMAWPKTGSLTPYVPGYPRKLAKPYALQPSTGSYVQTWLTGLLESASLYDQNNPNALIKLVPAHIRESGENTSAETYVQMVGHYFDTVRSYIKQYTNIHDRNESLDVGLAKDLVYHIGKSLNIEYDNGSSLTDLWNYTLGLDSAGSYTGSASFRSYGTSLQTTGENYTKEIWKRIINNLPYLLRTKGTGRGIRALINCFGIPRTILRIREYGGPEPKFDTTSQANYERFSFGLTVGVSQSLALSSTYGTGLYGVSPYGINSGTSFLYTAWPTESRAIELRFLADSGSRSKSQKTLLEIPNKFSIYVGNTTSETEIGFNISHSTAGSPSTGSFINMPSSLYDGSWTHLALITSRSGVNNITSSFNFYVSKVKYDKVITYSASLMVTASAYTGSLFGPYTSPLNIYLPGSASISSSVAGATHRSGLFSGSVQEFRIWTGSLSLDAVQQHALAPTSIVYTSASGFAGSTGSYNNLLFRLALGSDTQRRQVNGSTTISTTKFALTNSFSQHPNQNFTKSASFANFSAREYSYTPVTDTVNISWPDFGANRQIGNKVRIDNTTFVGPQLYKDNRAQKSLYTLYPTDSPRLGVYVSPTDEVNQDIAEYFGGLSIDDYIGDPTDLYEVSYKGLDSLRREYIKKQATLSPSSSLSRNDAQYYINLVRYFDSSLFKLIKNFAPQKANLQTGLVIESDMLFRNKMPITKPNTPENLEYDAVLSVTRSVSIGSAVQDGDGGLRHQADYVKDGVIKKQYIVPKAECFVEVDTVLDTENKFKIVSFQNQYNNDQIAEEGINPNTLYSTVDLGISGTGRDLRGYGSQYRYLTWVVTGSGMFDFTLIDALGEDYWNPLGPCITGSRVSTNYTGYNLTSSGTPAELQDYQVGEFASKGLKNVRYDGSKLISLDYNVDSNDTYDKGPVISIYQSDPKDLVVRTPIRDRRSQIQQSTMGGTFDIS